MATNLKLGDRLAIMRDGVNKGLTPQEAMASYEINKDGGYNNWKNLFKQATGINPDLDGTYDYEKFFKENPEAAKQLLEGKVSPDILQMYKTPQAIQKERQILRQNNVGSINDLMDYSKYEKIINDYMNRSANVHAYGGNLNMFAPGGQADPEPESNKIYAGKPSYTMDKSFKKGNAGTKNWFKVSTEELESFPKTKIDLSRFDLERDSSLPVEDLKALKRGTFVVVPALFFRDNNLPVNDDTASVLYYLSTPQEENEEYARKTGKKTKYIHELHRVDPHSKIGRAYMWLQDQLKKWEDYNTNRVYDNLDDPSEFKKNFKLLDDIVVYGKKSDQLDENQLEEELNIDLFKPTSTTETVDVIVPENYEEPIDTNPSILAPIGPINMVPKVPNTINVPDHFTISSNPTPEDKERNGLIPDGLDRDVKEKYLNMGLPAGDELHDFNNKPFSTVGSPGGSSLSTGNGGAEIGNGNNDTSTSGGIKMPDIFNLYDDLNYNTEIPFEDFLGDYDADYQYLETQVPTYETPVLYDLPPLGYVDIPNWNVLLIQDPGGDSGFWNFLALLLSYQQNNRSNINDELMSLLFKPKDYFADPYAGQHYTNTANFYDAYNNDPYTKILRESNGTPLYGYGGNLQNNSGKVNKFDGYGSSFIQTPWYDPWKGNPIGRQVAENNARQQQEFQQSLDEYAKKQNEYINAYKNWEYAPIEGEYPILTNVDIGGGETAPVYTIPGSVMSKAFPNYIWGDNLTWEPNTNYYTIKNANGLYASIPNNSYLSQQIDEWKLRVNDWNTQHSTPYWEQRFNPNIDTDALLQALYQYQHPQPTPPIFPELAQLNQDYRTDYEHLVNRNQFEHNNWLTGYLEQLQLENTIRDEMLRPFMPTNYIRATGDAAIGDDNWFSSFFDPNKHGMWIGPEGRAFLLNHPFMAGLLDFGVDMVGAKIIPKIGRPLKAAYNYSKPYIQHPTWRTYYHGAREPIDFNNINLGTSRNLGLHVGDKRIAQLFAARGNGNGVVYKVRAPRHKAETIDIRSNDYNLLSTEYPVKKTTGYRDGYNGDLKFKMLEEAGAKPTVIETPEGNLLYIENSVSLNLRERFPNVIKDPKLNARANKVIKRAEQAEKNGTMTPELKELLNLEATKILSDGGYDVVKYANAEPGEMPMGQTKPYYSYFINNSNKMEIMPTWKLALEMPLGKSLKSTKLTFTPTTDINTSTQPAFTYDPITGYTYTGYEQPFIFKNNEIGKTRTLKLALETALGKTSNTPKKPQTDATRPTKSTTSGYTELEIVEGAKAAKKQILDYLGSEEHILQIMKGGKSREEATTISNEMRNNVIRTEGPIVKDLTEKNRQGEYASSFGTVDELYNNAPEATIELMLDEPVTFRPHYVISPYVEDYLETIFHELGGHGANMGYSPENLLIINAANPKLGNKYLEALSQWFPHYLEVYDFNAKLKPVRKPKYTGKLPKRVKEHIEYLEDVDEYSARARAAIMGKDKGYKPGNDFKTEDFKYLERFFTKESLEKLLNNVWGISIPVTGGILLDDK